MNKHIVMACAVVTLMAGAHAAQAKTADQCFKIRCEGTTGTCFTFSLGFNMEMAFPGRLIMAQVPCDKSYGMISQEYPEAYGSVFLHDPVNQSSGLGLISTDAAAPSMVFNKGTGNGKAARYPGSQVFTDIERWRIALQQQVIQ